jgi:hypothetical protein
MYKLYLALPGIFCGNLGYSSILEALTMARNNSLVARYINEFASPVVMMVSTAEAEKVSLRNGLLLHELLSAFSHIDGVNSLLRLQNMNINVTECHLRFERSTEMNEKSGEILEQLLRRDFTDFDIEHLPSTSSALKNNPPTGWSRNVEELVMRSLSFNECEMMSAPLMIMSVVSTSDADPLASLEELMHQRHFPTAFTNAQYDHTIHRVFVVVHDATAINPATGAAYDVNAVMKGVYARYPSPRTKLMTLNSLPPDAPNVHQPDMWSRWMIPRFFPHLCPVLDTVPPPPTTTNEAAAAGGGGGSNDGNGGRPGEEKDVGYYGKWLSMEDFMTLREFCMQLFQHEIVPALERRISYLSKLVKENKKGMQNLFKSFMRKPREDLISGRYKGVRYTCDRIESQVLLLADTYFSLGAYDEAVSMYKMARDDFKADKSTMHEAYCLFQIIMRLSITQPVKVKERKEYIDQLHHLILSGQVKAPYAAFFACIVSEALVLNKQQQFPLDAAQMLLGAAGNVQQMPLLCALLTERAASLYLRAGRLKRFAFQEMLCGQRYASLPGKTTHHAAICYAAALVVYDEGDWTGVKAKVTRYLIDLITAGGTNRRGVHADGATVEQRRLDGAQRAFLIMLRALDRALTGTSRMLSAAAYEDASRLVREVSEPGQWGFLAVTDCTPSPLSDNATTQSEVHQGGARWSSCSALDLLNGALPLGPSPELEQGYSVVEGLRLPELETKQLALMRSVNGVDAMRALEDAPGAVEEQMTRALGIELDWLEGQRQSTASGGLTVASVLVLVEMWAAAEASAIEEKEVRLARGSKGGEGLGQSLQQHCVPLGEAVVVRLRLRNKLPMPLLLQSAQLTFDQPAAFHSPKVIDATIEKGCAHDLLLAAMPTQQGVFCAESARWRVGSALVVKQALVRRGDLQHKTLRQRMAQTRGPPRRMQFTVGAPYPNLSLSLHGLPKHSVAAGELIWGKLTLQNQGGAPAHTIHIKTSQPWCLLFADASSNPVVTGDGRLQTKPNATVLLPIGRSGTVFSLSSSSPSGDGVATAASRVVIQPGGSITVGVLLRFPASGSVRRLGFLASYNTVKADSATPIAFQGQPFRTSYVPLRVSVKRGQALELQTVKSNTQLGAKTLIVKMTNPDSQQQQQQLVNSRSANEQTGAAIATAAGGGGGGGALATVVRVESVLSFGPLCRSSCSSSANEHVNADYADSLTICVPVSVTEVSASNVSELLLSQQRQQPSGSDIGSGRQEEGGTNYPAQLVSCLAGRALAATRVLRGVSTRTAALKAEMDRAGAGPRSIAEVRRANKQNQVNNDPGGSSDISNKQKNNGIDGNNINNGGSGGDQTRSTTTTNLLSQAEADMVFTPGTDPAGLASLEAGGRAMTVAVLYSWNDSSGNEDTGATSPHGRRRVGLQWCSHVPFLEPVLASVTHASKVVLSSDGGGSNSSNGVVIPITLELRSSRAAPVKVSVRGLDLSVVPSSGGGGSGSSGSGGWGADGCSSSSSSSNAEELPSPSSSSSSSSSSPRPLNRGLRWIGKTCHREVVLLPDAPPVRLVFKAVASRCGVFDLGRFQLGIHREGDDEATSSNGSDDGGGGRTHTTHTEWLQLLNKQSLVEVVEDC